MCCFVRQHSTTINIYNNSDIKEVCRIGIHVYTKNIVLFDNNMNRASEIQQGKESTLLFLALSNQKMKNILCPIFILKLYFGCDFKK